MSTATPVPQVQRVIRRVETFVRAHSQADPAAVYLLTGDAGTGKSVVLNAVFTALQRAAKDPKDPLYGRANYLTVNHNEMLKVYRQAAKANHLPVGHLVKPTPLIHRLQAAARRADVIVIDEAQLLLSRSDPFNRYLGHDQLADLLAVAHVVVMVFDDQQVVKLKSHWDRARLSATLAGHPVAQTRLARQLRVQQPAVADWINAFAHGRLLPLPRVAQFDLRVFADGQPLYDWVQAADKRLGLSRLITTTDFPFRVFGDRTWYVDAGTLHLPWDKINFTDRPWAARPETLHEVGSIYTIQGFDLNVAGVILGPSLDYDPQSDRVVVDPARFEDQEAMRSRADLADPAAARRQLILNVANVLMKRGRAGLGLYAVNPALRHRLLQLAVL